MPWKIDTTSYNVPTQYLHAILEKYLEEGCEEGIIIQLGRNL